MGTLYMTSNIKDIVTLAKANIDLWHRRLGHTCMNTISKLIVKNLVKSLPKLNFEKDQIYEKQTRRSFKS